MNEEPEKKVFKISLTGLILFIAFVLAACGCTMIYWALK